MALREELVEDDVGRFDRQPAAVAHRIVRVHREVHDHLLQLPRIGLHEAAIADDRRQIDRLAEQAAQHRRQLADDVAEAQHADGENLLAAERQQLAREAGGALGRVADLLHVAEARIRLGQALRDEAGEAEDCRQQVVEIVGDASGQLADRLHLLRLAQLILERSPLRHVRDDAGAARRRAVGVVGETSDGRDPPRRSVRPCRPILELRVGARADRLVDPAAHRVAIVGMDAIEKRLERIAEIPRRHAVHLLAGVRPVRDAALEVRFPHADP